MGSGTRGEKIRHDRQVCCAFILCLCVFIESLPINAFPFTRSSLHLFPALHLRLLYSSSLYLFLFLPFVPLNTALTLIATQQTDSTTSPTSENLLAFYRCTFAFFFVYTFGSRPSNLSFLYIYIFNDLLVLCIPFQRRSLMLLPHSYVRTAVWRLNTNQINMCHHIKA